MKFLDNNETKLVEIGKLISFIVKLERIDENLRIELSNIKIWKEVILSVFHLFITIVVKRSKFKCKTERRYFFSRVGEGGAGAGPAAADSSSRQMLFHNETNQFSASSSGENKSTWFSLQTKITNENHVDLLNENHVDVFSPDVKAENCPSWFDVCCINDLEEEEEDLDWLRVNPKNLMFHSLYVYND